MNNEIEPAFRKMSEKECFENYGFSKDDMERLYNNGKPLIKYEELKEVSQDATSKKNNDYKIV